MKSKRNVSRWTAAGHNLVRMAREDRLTTKDVLNACLNQRGEPVTEHGFRQWLNGQSRPHQDQIETNARNIANTAAGLGSRKDPHELTEKYHKALWDLRQDSPTNKKVSMTPGEAIKTVASQDFPPEANSPAPDLFTGPGPWEELPEATTLAELRDFIRESGLHLSDLKSSGTLDANDLNLVARTALHCIPPTMSLSDGIEHVDYIQETVWRWAGLECDHGDERTHWAAKANLRRCRRALADLFRPLARNDEESRWLDEFFIPGPTLAGSPA